MKNLIALLIAMLISAAPLIGEEHGEGEGAEMPENRIGAIVAMTLVPEGSSDPDSKKGILVPTIGLEFLRAVAPHWELGVTAELELADYLIRDKELTRDNALLLLASATYELIPAWFLMIGGGVEFEEHKNLGVLRLGTLYEFPLGHEFDITPFITWDYKFELNALALGVSVGKRF
jgi:hypothetical protein